MRDDAGLVELPLLHAHADALDRLPRLARHGPFDRAPAAQALTEGLVLLTADEVLLDVPGLAAVDARR